MLRVPVIALSGFVIGVILWMPLQFYRSEAWSDTYPAYGVNRAIKGDRLQVVPRSIVRTAPSDVPREPVKPAPTARELPFGCEPSFSPVTVPSMAHIAGRCFG
jgi:hypothetical protein